MLFLAVLIGYFQKPEGFRLQRRGFKEALGKNLQVVRLQWTLAGGQGKSLEIYQKEAVSGLDLGAREGWASGSPSCSQRQQNQFGCEEACVKPPCSLAVKHT